MSILLIYPPFGALGAPYVSIPVLAAYLRDRNVEVHAYDANNEFFRRFLSLDNLRAARDFAENRASELNSRPSLRFSEMMEFRRLLHALTAVEEAGEDLERILDTEGSFAFGRRARAIHAAMHLACCPHFPESLQYLELDNIIVYMGALRKFATPDLLKAARDGVMTGMFIREAIPALIREHKPDIAGISAAFPDQIHSAMHIAAVIKEARPETHVTLGGPFVSCHMREPADPALFDVVDSLVLDDGELPLERLHREIAGGDPDFSTVPGLVWRHGGAVRVNDPEPPIEAASLSFPDYSVFPLDRYLLPRRVMPMLFPLSRGCWWARCAFCRTRLSMIRHHRQPLADRLFEGIRETVERTGCRIFNFTDDSASPEVLEELSRRIIENSLDIRWIGHTRFDPRLTVERCALFRRAGCHYLNLGLESCSDRILKLMNKGITISLAERVLGNMWWPGLRAAIYMIVGFPTETEEEALTGFAQVERWLADGKIVNCMYHAFNVVDYSDVAGNPERYGIRSVARDPESDLSPPVFDFESGGMNRSKAMELSGQFNRRVLSILRPGMAKARDKAPRLVVEGVERPLHYDPLELSSILERVAFEKSGFNLGRMLEWGDRAVPPLRTRAAQSSSTTGK